MRTRIPSFVSIRSKLLAVFFVFGIAPLLLLSVVNYLNGVRTVEDLLREEVGYRATRMARDVKEILRDREADLSGLARSRSLREYVRAARPRPGAEALRRASPAADGPVAIRRMCGRTSPHFSVTLIIIC